MKKKLLLVLLLSSMLTLVYSENYSGKVYSFTLTLDKGNLLLSELFLVSDGFYSEPIFETAGNLTLKLLSYSGEELFQEKFFFSEPIIEDPRVHGLEETEQEFEIAPSLSFVVPFNEEAEKFAVLNEQGENVLEFSVMHFSDYCGNFICSEKESSESCANDCEVIEVIAEETKEVQETQPIQGFDFSLIFGVFIVLIIGAVIYFKVLKK